MLQQRCLSWSEAERAVAAVFEEAGKDGRPMSVAVVDNHGELIACGRMDGCPARVLRHAIRKAYTAAVLGRDTLKFKQDLQEREGNLDEWGDLNLTTLQGGLVVLAGGQVAGGLGVGGNTSARDQEVAQIALRAMGYAPAGIDQAQ